MAALSLAFDVIARDQNATRTLNNVADSADRAGRAGSRFGSAMKAGVGLAIGAIASLGLASAFRSFIDEANEAAKVGRLTNAVVTSTGGVANVTAGQVADLAEALSVKAGVDDELIQSGANVLLTFTKIRNEVGAGNDIFDQATAAALNMSTALGQDLQGSVTMIGKALNDPIKGITALGRAGIQFTADQKEQIKTLTESGDILSAQKIILAELETQFGGAAEAAASPLDRLKVSAGNLGEALGGLLLPNVGKFADFLTTSVIPKVQQFVEDFAAGTGRIGEFKNTLIGLKDAAVGVFNILFKGDFTGGIFGLEEDSKLVGFLFGVRDAAMDFADALRQLWQDGQAAVDVLVTGLKPVWDELVAVWNSDLKPAFQELMTTLRDELGPVFGQAADEQGPMLKNLAEMTVSLVKFLLPSIVRGIQIFAAFVQAIASVVGPLVNAWQWSSNLALKVTDLTIRVQAFVRDSVAGIQLFGTRFVGAFTNARDGAVTAIAGVIATVRGLPGQVTGALGNVGNLLRNAGRNLIQGFIDGIREMISTVRSTLANLTSSLPDWKGPMALDRVILRPSGAAVIDGFIGGLESRYGAVRNTLNGLTSDIGATGTNSAAAARQPVILQLPNGRVLAEFVLGEAGVIAEQGAWS